MKPHPDLVEMERLLPYIREYQALASKSVFENAAPECARPGRSQMNPSSAFAKIHARRCPNIAAPGDGRTPAWTGPRAKTNFQTRSKRVAWISIDPQRSPK